MNSTVLRRQRARQLTISLLAVFTLLAVIALPANAKTKHAKHAKLAVCSVSVVPYKGVQVVNVAQTVTVSALKGTSKSCHAPAGKVTITVKVTSGPDVGKTTTLTTNRRGQAAYSYTSAKPGEQTVRFSSGKLRADLTNFWILPDGSGGAYGEGGYTQPFPGVHEAADGKDAIVLYIHRHVKASFALKPTFLGAKVLSVKLTIDGKKFHARHGIYSINIKKLSKRITKHKVVVTAQFADAKTVVLKGSFTTPKVKSKKKHKSHK